MTQSVELTLDSAAETAVREQWARLAEAGLTATPVLTDLAGLTRDAAFRDAVAPPDPFDEYARPCTPWEFA